MNKDKMIALAQGQLDSYNQRNIDTFCSFYHPEVQVFRVTQIGQNEKVCSGMEAFRKIYEARFNDCPDLFCELRSRIVLNDSVLDEEWVTGGGPTPSHVVAIYGFKDDLISHVWFAR